MHINKFGVLRVFIYLRECREKFSVAADPILKVDEILLENWEAILVTSLCYTGSKCPVSLSDACHYCESPILLLLLPTPSWLVFLFTHTFIFMSPSPLTSSNSYLRYGFSPHD